MRHFKKIVITGITLSLTLTGAAYLAKLLDESGLPLVAAYAAALTMLATLLTGSGIVFCALLRQKGRRAPR